MIEPWVNASLHDLIPDEIVILLNQLAKLKDAQDLIEKTVVEIQENYVLSNLAQNQIDTLEVLKIHASLKSPTFKDYLSPSYLK